MAFHSGTVMNGGKSFTGTVGFYNTTSYTLTNASAAIDAGTNAGVMTDFQGDARPQGNGFDMGWDESPFSSAMPTQTTLVISNSTGGSLSAPSGAVTLTFPSGAVSGTTNITYTQLTTPTQATTAFKFIGESFTLVATDQNGNPVTQFSSAYTLTLHYADSDWQNAGIPNESALSLYYWNGSAWVNILPCAGCALDTVNNTLTVRLNHFTEFALLAPSSYKLFLPFIRR